MCIFEVHYRDSLDEIVPRNCILKATLITTRYHIIKDMIFEFPSTRYSYLI